MISFFRNISWAHQIIVFGSVARGEADRLSDIDLLLVMNGGPAAYQAVFNSLQKPNLSYFTVHFVQPFSQQVPQSWGSIIRMSPASIFWTAIFFLQRNIAFHPIATISDHKRSL
jgi:hypothetical protein